MATRAPVQRQQPEIIDLSSDSSDSSSDDATLASPPRQQTAPLDLDNEDDFAPLDFDDDGNLAPLDEPAWFADLYPRSPPMHPQNAPIRPDVDLTLGSRSPEVLVNSLPGAFPEYRPDDTLEPTPDRALGGQIVNIDGEDIFIPDEEAPLPNPSGTALYPPSIDMQRTHEVDVALAELVLTADSCLQRVLEVFPDISHAHVIELYNEFDTNSDYENMPGPARFDNIIDKLLSATSYPKQEKGKQSIKKRKREESIGEDDLKRWEGPDREIVPGFLKGSMQAMLKAEFPEMTITFVNSTLAAQKHFYQAYVTLAAAKDGPTHLYGKGRPSGRHLANADTVAVNSGWPAMMEELTAARKRVQVIRAQRAVEDEKKRVEEKNMQTAKERGETAECQACFDDLPMNRQIHCDGTVAHFTCYECAEAYIKAEIGESRCRVLCTAGCGAGFAPNQLKLLPCEQLLEKLAELEQEKAIRDAGLDDLEECPFCDYKAILPPIDVDFEFRCANEECEKVSCRRCKSISHIPISCEAHAKDNKINSRHKIEEAMTAAMIRSCNKCKKQFIKEYGCNKMTCPSCSNLQCYVCSESIGNYDHFDQGGGRTLGRATKCPLYDNVEERHEREVKEAEETARAAVVAENPDVSMDDLEIKVSDAVKKSTADRIKKGGGVGGVPHMHDMGGFMPQYQAAMAAIHGRLLAGGPGGNPHLGDDGDEDDDVAVHGLQNAPAVRRGFRQLRVQQEAFRLQRDALLAARPRVGPGIAPPDAQPAPNLQGYIPVYGFQQAPHRHRRPIPPPFAGDLVPPPPPARGIGPDGLGGLFEGLFDELDRPAFDFNQANYPPGMVHAPVPPLPMRYNARHVYGDPADQIPGQMIDRALDPRRRPGPPHPHRAVADNTAREAADALRVRQQDQLEQRRAVDQEHQRMLQQVQQRADRRAAVRQEHQQARAARMAAAAAPLARGERPPAPARWY